MPAASTISGLLPGVTDTGVAARSPSRRAGTSPRVGEPFPKRLDCPAAARRFHTNNGHLVSRHSSCSETHWRILFTFHPLTMRPSSPFSVFAGRPSVKALEKPQMPSLYYQNWKQSRSTDSQAALQSFVEAQMGFPLQLVHGLVLLRPGDFPIPPCVTRRVQILGNGGRC